MRLAGKTACLFFLFILISPLFAQPSPDEVDDGLFFFEELFITEEALSFGESLIDEEASPGEAAFLDEETSFDESPAGDETLLSEETLSDEEAALIEEAFYFEAPPLIFEVPEFETRSLDVLFPHLSRIQRMVAMNNEGLRRYFLKDEPAMFIPAPDMGINILDTVMKKNPSHLIEALIVVPYNGREFDLLDIYNALGRIEKIKDYPVLLNGNDFYIFTESTRIESVRNRKAVSDPLPAVRLPFAETMHLRLKEINFGNLFIRADISISIFGITYSMTNFTDVRYFLLPIMRAERYVTIIYLEPVKEGVLIYSITGFYLPGFIADRVNLTPNINRRLNIFIRWITDGLRMQETQ